MSLAFAMYALSAKPRPTTVLKQVRSERAYKLSAVSSML